MQGSNQRQNERQSQTLADRHEVRNWTALRTGGLGAVFPSGAVLQSPPRSARHVEYQYLAR